MRPRVRARVPARPARAMRSALLTVGRPGYDRRGMRSWVALACVVAACTSGPGVDVDAGAGDAGTSLAAPAAPASPEFACPSGWRARAEGSLSLCAPWTDERAPTCGPLEHAVVGAAGAPCAPVASCPAGAWPDDAPAGAVYVLAGAAGDGSMASPLGTIAAGLALAGEGGTVVVGAGTYQEALRIDGTRTILGVCPERVTIRDVSVMPQAPIVLRAGAHLTLRGVALEGDEHDLWLLSGASADVSGVAMHGAQPLILESTASLVADHVRLTASARACVVALPDATLVLSHAHLDGGEGALRGDLGRGGLEGTAQVTVTDSAILDTGYGWADRLSGAMERVAIERVDLGALVLVGRELSLTDVHAREVAANGPGARGYGFLVVTGTAHVRRVAVTDVVADHPATAAALLVDALPGAVGGPATLDGGDLVVARTMGTAALDVGSSAASENVPSATLSRVALVDLAAPGLVVHGGGVATLDDLRVAAGAPVPNAHAVSASGVAQLTLVRASLAPSGESAAALVVDVPARADVSDLTVTGGIGVVAQCSGTDCTTAMPTLQLARAHVASSSRYGVAAIGGPIEMQDVRIDTVAYAGGTAGAFGVVAANHAHVSASRVVVTGVEGVGVAALAGATLDVDGLDVGGTAPVVFDGDPTQYWGDALVCGSGGALHVADFRAHDSVRAGLTISFDCAPSSARGEIDHNAIGVLNDDRWLGGFDFSMIDVHDNTVPSNSTHLEVPNLDPQI